MNIPNCQYVVFKGVEGFADRLQCLLQVIAYAKKTGRILVIDWRDADWQHSPLIVLSDYLYLEGINCLSIYEFLTVFTDSPSTLSVYPEVWRQEIHKPDFRDFCRGDQYKLPDNSRAIQAICDGDRQDFMADVVVYVGFGLLTSFFTL